MDLHDFLQADRKVGGGLCVDGVQYITVRPPASESLQLPAVRQAVRAVAALKATRSDVEILRHHWMMLEI